MDWLCLLPSQALLNICQWDPHADFFGFVLHQETSRFSHCGVQMTLMGHASLGTYVPLSSAGTCRICSYTTTMPSFPSGINK